MENTIDYKEGQRSFTRNVVVLTEKEALKSPQVEIKKHPIFSGVSMWTTKESKDAVVFVAVWFHNCPIPMIINGKVTGERKISFELKQFCIDVDLLIGTCEKTFAIEPYREFLRLKERNLDQSIRQNSDEVKKALFDEALKYTDEQTGGVYLQLVQSLMPVVLAEKNELALVIESRITMR